MIVISKVDNNLRYKLEKKRKQIDNIYANSQIFLNRNIQNCKFYTFVLFTKFYTKHFISGILYIFAYCVYFLYSAVFFTV